MDLKRGIDWGVARIVKELHDQATDCKTKKDIASVGTISANGDATIGEIIADAMDKVGKDGVITVEEQKASRRTSISSRACSSTAVICRRTS